MDIWDGKCVGSDDTCCVCGSSRTLTRHHVVPGCYREPLHHARNYHDRHDVLIICVKCHNRYEHRHAKHLKLALCKKYGVPLDGVGIIWPHGIEVVAASRAAMALLRHSARMPPERIAELRATIVSHLGREPREQDMSELAETDWRPKPGPDYVSHGELIVARVEDMQAFWRMWRTHFVKKMKPRFLPRDWDSDREVRWLPERCRRRRGSNCPCASATAC